MKFLTKKAGNSHFGRCLSVKGQQRVVFLLTSSLLVIVFEILSEG